MHAARTAINEFSHIFPGSRLKRISCSFYVNFIVIAAWNVQFPERGCQVVNNIDAFHALINDHLVSNAADHNLGAPVTQLVCLDSFLVIQGDDLVAFVKQTLDQRFAGKTCTACYQNSHY